MFVKLRLKCKFLKFGLSLSIFVFVVLGLQNVSVAMEVSDKSFNEENISKDKGRFKNYFDKIGYMYKSYIMDDFCFPNIQKNFMEYIWKDKEHGFSIYLCSNELFTVLFDILGKFSCKFNGEECIDFGMNLENDDISDIIKTFEVLISKEKDLLKRVRSCMPNDFIDLKELAKYSTASNDLKELAKRMDKLKEDVKGLEKDINMFSKHFVDLKECINNSFEENSGKLEDYCVKVGSNL